MSYELKRRKQPSPCMWCGRKEVDPEYEAMVEELVEALFDIAQTKDCDYTSNNITASKVLDKYESWKNKCSPNQKG